MAKYTFCIEGTCKVTTRCKFEAVKVGKTPNLMEVFTEFSMDPYFCCKYLASMICELAPGVTTDSK